MREHPSDSMPRISGYLRTHDGVGLPYCRLELWAGGGTAPGAAVPVAPRPAGSAPTPVAVAVRPDRLVVGNLHTNDRGRFSIDYPDLPAGELPFLKYFLEDRRTGSTSTVFELKYDASNIWSVRYPDRPPGEAARYITRDGLDIRPPRRVLTFRPGTVDLQARVHRAVLAYELCVNQHLWFDRQIASAQQHYGDFVRSGWTPPPASRFQLQKVTGTYIGTAQREVSYYWNHEIHLEPDNNLQDAAGGGTAPDELTDQDYQWVIPHELGHYIFNTGHPGYVMPGGNHSNYGGEVHRHYLRSYLADTSGIFGTNNVFISLIDPRGQFRQFLQSQARHGAFVQQLAMDFSEGYATYIGKSFNYRRSRDGAMETPDRNAFGVGDQPTASFLWDLSDQTSDGGIDRLGIPFGVVHMLCCKWGDQLQSGTHDVPASIHFGTAPADYGAVGHDARTLPGFFAYLRENLNDRYRPRLDALVRPNRLTNVFSYWNYIRTQHGQPAMPVTGVPVYQPPATAAHP